MHGMNNLKKRSPHLHPRYCGRSYKCSSSWMLWCVSRCGCV